MQSSPGRGRLGDASWLTTDRTVGVSQEAFSFGNLAGHVGDDPAAVRSNRRRAAADLGATDIAFARAAHGAGVVVVSGPGPDVPGADGLITNVAGLAVAAQSADCAAVALATRDGWVAAAHCGWRGLVEGIIPAVVAALADTGADPVGIRAHVGPTICARCYPVPDQRWAQVRRVVPRAATAGRSAIDLRAGVAAHLAQAGVRFTVDPRCTFESPDLYSFRRDGVTGRQATIVVRGGSGRP